MNWLGLAFILALAGVVAYLYTRNKNTSDRSWKNILINDFAVIAYDEKETEKAKAEFLAMRFRHISMILWPRFCKIYGEKITMNLEKICLDRKYTYDGEPSGGKLYRREMTMYLRPQGTDELDVMLYFALELHNLYRGWALGMDWYKMRPGEEKRWNAAIRACKKGAA